MGRPKKLSFPCTYCDKTFKRKVFLEKHLQSHSDISGQRRRARIRSNWCHVCRKSFASSEYKLHIMTEHQYDSYKMYTDDSGNENEDIKQSKSITVSTKCDGNFATNKDAYIVPNKIIKQEIDTSPRKRTVKISKTLQAEPACSLIKIKTEPPDVFSDTNKSTTSPKKRKNFYTKSLFIICSKCGMKCKGQRGLKIHLSTTHKRNSSNNYKHKSPSKVVEINRCVQLKQEKPNKASAQCKNSIASSVNSQPLFVQNTASNLSQNAQTGLMYNMFPIQNHSLNNIVGIGNQSNLQILPVVHQNPPVETIPKFDHNSENYIKWLKKFINRCKMHKYPLTPMLCQSISHINEEIIDALNNPVGSMRKRSNHFYFMRIQSVLAEIMIGQMRYSLNVVTR